MRKLILISAFVSASFLASVSVQAQSLGSQSPGAQSPDAQSLGTNDAVETASPDGAVAKPQAASKLPGPARPVPPAVRVTSRKGAGSPPSTVSIGDPQFLQRGGDVLIGIRLT